MTTISPSRISTLESDWLPRLELLEQIHNFAAVCRNERIVYLNAAGAQILGLQQDDRALNVEFVTFLHPDFKETASLGLAVFAEDDSIISIKFVRADGIEIEADLWVSQVDAPGETSYLIEARDITAHMRSARALRSRELRLEGILNTVADGIMSLDDHGNIQSFNPAAEKIFGFSRDEAIGNNIRILMPLPVEGDSETNFDTEWATALTPDREILGRRKDGNTFPMEMAVREMRQGGNLSFTSIVRDITARKKTEERVYQLAHFDPLTGLPNRHLLADRLEEAIKRASRNNKQIGLMFIDLDKFKDLNDEFGHAAGDTALKLVSNRLVTSARRTDTVSRVGGDEFVAVLEELHSIEEAELVATKMIEAVSEVMEINGKDCTVGASVGISIYPDHASNITDLLHCADQAMYTVKRKRGKDHLYVFTPETSETPEA